MLAEPLHVVIGVDTHKHTHTAAAVSPTGAVLDQLTVPADAKGCRRLIAFGERHDGRVWVIEGTASCSPFSPRRSGFPASSGRLRSRTPPS